MNLKNKFRILRKEEGFTLVELIVVIAVVAILGGVAVPAYTGYIEKTKITADKQLLADVNKAFISACMMAGESNINHPEAKDQKIVNKILTYDGPNAEYFNNFYEGGNFEVATYLEYDKDAGAFTAPELDDGGNGGVPVTIGGKTYYISQSSIDALKGSVYYEHMEDMQNQVNSLANAYGNFLSDANADTLKDLFGEDYYEAIKDYVNDPEKLGNATVLYVAEQTKNMTPDQAFESLATVIDNLGTGDGTMGNLLDALDASGQDPLPTLALAYGTITAYANNPGNPGAGELKNQLASVKDTNSLMAVFNTAVSDEYFEEFMKYAATDGQASDAFTNDIGGYIGALDIVGSASGSLTEEDLGKNDLWTGDKVNEVLGQIKN